MAPGSAGSPDVEEARGESGVGPASPRAAARRADRLRTPAARTRVVAARRAQLLDRDVAVVAVHAEESLSPRPNGDAHQKLRRLRSSEAARADSRPEGAYLPGMSSSPPRVWVITGLMAAGKSTVAQALAERLHRSVHLRGDIFRKMVVNGREDMSPEPSAEALAQLELRHGLTVETARAYADAGFTVVLQDVILGSHLAGILAGLEAYAPGLVVLDPSLDVVAERDRGRAKTVYAGDWTPAALAQGLRELPPTGLWVDSSAQSVDETVDYILANADQARVSPAR